MLYIKCLAQNKHIINAGPQSSYRDSKKEGTISESSLIFLVPNRKRSTLRLYIVTLLV